MRSGNANQLKGDRIDRLESESGVVSYLTLKYSHSFRMLRSSKLNHRATTTIMDYQAQAQAQEEARRVKEEKANIKKLFGKLNEKKHIQEAVQYEASLRNSEEDCFKRQLSREYIAKDSNGLHARVEMSIYRMMGETSIFFVRGQALDYDTLKPFLSIMEFWAFLAMAGGLGPFLGHKDVKKVYKGDGSAAEVFRAFLDVAKAKAKFDKWDQYRMNEVLYMINTIVDDVHNCIIDYSPATTPG